MHLPSLKAKSFVLQQPPHETPLVRSAHAALRSVFSALELLPHATARAPAKARETMVEIFIDGA